MEVRFEFPLSFLVSGFMANVRLGLGSAEVASVEEVNVAGLSRLVRGSARGSER